ncbi:hypothetical protein SAY87_026772 [Trapa incisa]|uniref:Uncharacterized protein n=1 Tax=Trapa incisa TaxID=236973 RepID=A0AAN7GS14_9MYRT|nr:hypothetical protein SAY87_026772 [Trapa incisa]
MACDISFSSIKLLLQGRINGHPKKDSPGLDNYREKICHIQTFNAYTRRPFVIGMEYLMHPKFLELLEKAEREFGFDQMGVLVIPCKASELRRILLQKLE